MGLGEEDAAGALGRCVAEVREAMPRALAGALAVLDDTVLTEDGCRLDLAVRRRAPGWCDGVVYAPVRTACQRRSAIAARRPEACPWASTRRHRDPLCVALAARDPRLCVAAGATERITCTAAATHDPRRCAALDPALRPSCVREVAVLAPLGPPMVLRHPLPAQGGVSAPEDDGGPGWALSGVERGVFLDDAGWVWIVDPAVGWPAGVVAPETARFGVRVRPGTRPGEPDGLEARVELPGRAPLDTRSGSLALQGPVRWTARGSQRGARSAAELVLVAPSSAGALRLRVWWDSFIRDLIPADTLR